MLDLVGGQIHPRNYILEIKYYYSEYLMCNVTVIEFLFLFDTVYQKEIIDKNQLDATRIQHQHSKYVKRMIDIQKPS